MMRTYFLPILLICSAAAPKPTEPNCSRPDHYPAMMAFVKLKNAGKLTNETVVFPKVTSVRLVSQRIRQDLWRQVFRVTFPLTSGKRVEAIVVSDASSDECSMAAPQIFVVSENI